MSNTNLNGVKIAFVTALISGFSIFINKYAVGAITPPIMFTAVKNTMVGVMIISILLGAKKIGNFKSLSKKDISRLLIIGIIGGAIPFYLFFTGLSITPAVNAALIHKTLVLWVALLAVPLLKEKISKLQMVGLLALFGSNLFVGGFTGFKFSPGELMILAATFFWAIENIYAKKVLENVDPDVVTFARMGIGSLILLVAASIVAPGSLGTVFKMNTSQIMWMVVTAAALLGYVSTWYRALKVAPAITVTAVLATSTLVTNVLSAIFVTHAWNVQLLPQIGLSVLGLALFWVAAKKDSEVITA